MKDCCTTSAVRDADDADGRLQQREYDPDIHLPVLVTLTRKQ
jgi:hypothetical protein